jgi:uncharacterized protein YbjT (DUF2867 family)
VRVILFGATGMVGQGVLRECLLDPEVSAVLSVVRKASGAPDAKLKEIVAADFYDFSAMKDEFAGYDACFFCLGVSSFGMKEPEYRRITYDITLAAANAMVSPAMKFCYVSGGGTDAKSSTMWARVKGETENALLAMPFKAAYMFRPGAIMPMDGITSKTPIYRVGILLLKPFFPLLIRKFPQYATTTRQVGVAMLAVAKRGFAKPVLEAVDIARV